MKVAILAGGLGTRLQEETGVKPKPMVEIGGEPVLRHIMKIYSSQGFNEFVIALGYRGDVIKDYFLNYRYHSSSMTIDLGSGEVEVHECRADAWRVHLLDTGLHTETGGRVRRVAEFIGDETFMLTYGDGVADIDLDALMHCHRNQSKLATVSAVRPPARFGEIGFSDDGVQVTRFEEKPQLGEGWINGGFFVLEPGIAEYITGDASVFEREPLERIAKDGQLVAYRHHGFWQCMDTLRDKRQLEALWQNWKRALEGDRMKSSFWCDRPTLVTGATGLLGSWLVPRLLDATANVVCIIRDWTPKSHLISGRVLDEVTVIRGDICDRSMIERVLAEYEIDTVIHLAAQTIVPIANRNPASTFESNITGTWRLLEACRRSPAVQQIVVASSDKAYGEHATLPYDESCALRAVHPYDVSKACSDLLAQSYAHTFDLPVVVTRCGNLFGGGDLNWNRIVPGTIRAVLRGQRPVIRSDGQLVRDYFFVEDCAAAYMLLAEKLAEDHGLSGEAFNFSAEQPLTVLEMVDTILRVMGSDLQPDVRNTANNEINEQYLSASKARSELEWQPLYTLEEGIDVTASWYKRLLGDGAVPAK